MNQKQDGEDGTHWFCGCDWAAQECHCHDCLLQQRDEARAQTDRLKEALRKYAEHQGECWLFKPGKDNLRCTCGLDDALEAVEPARAGEEG